MLAVSYTNVDGRQKDFFQGGPPGNFSNIFQEEEKVVKFVFTTQK